VQNVRYSVQFLQSLFAETGNWNTAAAYYHSRTADYALPYQRKVLAQMPGSAKSAALFPGAQLPGGTALSPPTTALSSAWAATLSGTQLASQIGLQSGLGQFTPASGGLNTPDPGLFARRTSAARRPPNRTLLASRH
jgi:hypothetical protein